MTRNNIFESWMCIYSLLLICQMMTPVVRFSRSVGFGDLHRSDGHLLWETLPGLALLLVLHHRLGGHHSGLCRRYSIHLLFFLLNGLQGRWCSGMSHKHCSCSSKTKFRGGGIDKFSTYDIWQCKTFLSGVFQLCAYQRTTAQPAPPNNVDTWTGWGLLQ